MEYPGRDRKNAIRRIASRRSTRRARRRRQRREQLIRTQQRQPMIRTRSINASSESLRIHRRELLITYTSTANQDVKNVLPFNLSNYPPWLKKLCALYEQIQFHKLVIHAVSHFATTTSGAYYLSYNSSSGDVILAQDLSPEIMKQQRNSVTATIFNNAYMIIPKPTFNQPLKRPLCKPNDADHLPQTWICDLMTLINASSVSKLDLEIEYDVTLYTPNARD